MSDFESNLRYARRAEAARQLAKADANRPLPDIFLGLSKLAPVPTKWVGDPAFDHTDLSMIGRSFEGITSARRGTDDRHHDAISLMAADALPQMIWSTLADGYHDYYNAQWYAFTGVEAGTTDGDGWNGMFHADDQKTSWACWQHCLATGEPYEVEYRLRRHDGEYRWMLGRALPMHGKSGAIVRWVGTCTDIHEARVATDRNALLAREMDHRIANLFAIVGSLMALEARDANSAKALAETMQARLSSLNAAHRLVQRTTDKPVAKASVHGIIRAVATPYENSAGTRIAVSGPDCDVDDDAVTSIALLMHELCTNAVKYGALQHATGTIAVTTGIFGPLFKVDWVERGTPAMIGQPLGSGFGTVLITATVEQQLGGAIQREWAAEGLSIHIAMALSRLGNTPAAR